MKTLTRYAAILLTLTLVLSQQSCTTTVAPPLVVAHQPSFDGNDANSGVVRVLPDHYFEVSTQWFERYVALTGKYGKLFSPPLRAENGVTQMLNGNFKATKQVMANNNTMLFLKRNGE